MTATSVATGWYVYGVVPAGVDPALFAATPGVDVDPVALVTADGLAAIVSTVSLDNFDEQALRRNLEVPAWLEEKARAHDRVLGCAVGRVPLVPLRFGTVYRDEEGVRRMLGERGAELASSLERLHGRFWLAAGVSFAGVALIALGKPGGVSGSLKGDLLGIATAAT